VFAGGISRSSGRSASGVVWMTLSKFSRTVVGDSSDIREVMVSELGWFYFNRLHIEARDRASD
jgi:hypothetical protein